MNVPTCLLRNTGFSKWKGLFWFRLFGWGLHFKNREMHRDLFSERNGLVSRIVIGKYAIKLLKPK